MRELNESNCIINADDVIIENVRHRVSDKFVFCDSGLNSRAWGVTEEKGICGICFPDQKLTDTPEKKSMFGEQLKMF